MGFEYAPFVNPYGASIGDTIARSHDAEAHAAEMTALAAARAAEIKGQAWGSAVQNIAQIPAQIEAAKSAALDRKLKETALQQTIQDKQQAAQQHIVRATGRIAAGSNSPEDFVSGIQSLVQLGAVPKDVAAHMVGQVQAAGPDGWEALKGKYVDFGNQYEDAVKLGKDEVLTRGGKVIASNSKPELKVLRPGDNLVQPGEGAAPATTLASAPFSPSQTTAVVNGAVVPLSGPNVGQPVAPAVPKQEGASEVALNAARVDEINKKIEEVDNQIAGSMPITAKDRAELAIKRQQLEIERSHYKAIETGADINSPKNQERLEQSYATLLKTTQSSRSGGLGLEDKKVDQAKHLLALMDQQKDAQGQYHITPTQQAELSIGLATLLSPTGQPSDHTIQLINQKTAEGDLAKLITYATGTPVKGTPQDLAQQLRDSIERQGVQAETNREGHFNQLRAFAPTDLSADRRDRLEKGLIGANRLSVEVDVPGVGAMRFPTQTAADKFTADARAKGLMK